MNNEIYFIVILLIGLYFVFNPFRSKYKLERFKPLVIIPVLLAGIIRNGKVHKPSVIFMILCAILLGYIVWKIYTNVKSIKNDK